MALYGHARVSTTDQDLDIQLEALKRAACDIVSAEKRTGTTRDGRTELRLLFDFLRPGDVLVVTRIDRMDSAHGPFRRLATHCDRLIQWANG